MLYKCFVFPGSTWLGSQARAQGYSQGNIPLPQSRVRTFYILRSTKLVYFLPIEAIIITPSSRFYQAVSVRAFLQIDIFFILCFHLIIFGTSNNKDLLDIYFKGTKEQLSIELIALIRDFGIRFHHGTLLQFYDST